MKFPFQTESNVRNGQSSSVSRDLYNLRTTCIVLVMGLWGVRVTFRRTLRPANYGRAGSHTRLRRRANSRSAYLRNMSCAAPAVGTLLRLIYYGS